MFGKADTKVGHQVTQPRVAETCNDCFGGVFDLCVVCMKPYLQHSASNINRKGKEGVFSLHFGVLCVRERERERERE